MKGGKYLNKKIRKYLDEIEKTEKKIADLQQYLKEVRDALKKEEDSEMVRSIRSMNLDRQELFRLLEGIQNGNVSYQEGTDPDEKAGSFVYHNEKEEREEEDHGETQKTE